MKRAGLGSMCSRVLGVSALWIASMAMSGCYLYIEEPSDEESSPGSGGSAPGTPGPGQPVPPGQTIPLPPSSPPPSPLDWEPYEFEITGEIYCDGARYVRYDENHAKYVGAVLCSPERYKLYMSEKLDEPFLEIADYAGHGQDHCELVDARFAIPNEDDITSGGCTKCAVGGLVDPIGVPVYARGYFGEPFTAVVSSDWADLTTTWYECGVTIP